MCGFFDVSQITPENTENIRYGWVIKGRLKVEGKLVEGFKGYVEIGRW